jgi:thiol-disulfide isomerase/thioredoxin
MPITLKLFMKNTILAVFFLFGFMANAQVIFQKSLKEAFDVAKKQDKMVFIDYYNSDCSVCKKVMPLMDDVEIGEFYNQNFVNYKINTKDESSQADVEFLIGKGLHIDGVPKFIFFDKNEQFIHFSGIGPEKQAFFDVGQAALDPVKQLSKTPELYKSGDRSLKLLYAYSSYALLLNDKELANKIADDLFEAFPKENLDNVSSYFVLKNAVFTTENGFYKHWANNLDKLTGFEQGPNEGKEKEQLERIIANDLTNPKKQWTTAELIELRSQIQKINPSLNIDNLLWEKELDAFVKDNKTQELNNLLTKMLQQNKSEVNSMYYIIVKFVSTLKSRENLLFLKSKVEELITQYSGFTKENEKAFVQKLKQLL